MNRRGQVLLIFLIILPIFLVFMAIIVDVSLIQIENRKLNQVTEMLLDDYYDKRMDEDVLELVKSGFIHNQIDVSNLQISGASDYFKIENQVSISSIFGKIVGFQYYDISVSLKLIMKNHEKIYEKE